MFNLPYKPLVFARICFISLTMLMAGIGVYGNVLTDADIPDYYISYWFFKDYDTVSEVQKLGCIRIRQRLQAASGVAIAAMCLLFIMWVVSWYDMFMAPRITTKIIYHFSQFCSWGLLLIAWGINIAFYNQDWCGNYVPKENNFKLGFGTILMITSWAVSFIHIILYILADPAAGEFDEFETDTDSETEDDEEMKADDANAPDHNAARAKESAPMVDTVNAPDAPADTVVVEEEPAVKEDEPVL